MNYLILIFSLLINLPNAPIAEIEFGSGGGFTGAIKAYALNNKGELYKLDPFAGGRELVKKVDASTTASLFQRIEEDGLLKIKINKPGNTYKFLKLSLLTTSHELVWVGNSDNKNLNLFYADLKALCKSNE